MMRPVVLVMGITILATIHAAFSVVAAVARNCANELRSVTRNARTPQTTSVTGRSNSPWSAVPKKSVKH